MRVLLRTPPLLIPTVLFAEFLPWYFLHVPRVIFRMYVGYARAFATIFSILFLLRTLVSPWKSIADQYPASMLQLGTVFKVWTLNCTARGVGLVVRTITIIAGLILQVLLLIAFVTVMSIWIGFPLFALVGMEYVIFTFQST